MFAQLNRKCVHISIAIIIVGVALNGGRIYNKMLNLV
jgi:hypothetical protein